MSNESGAVLTEKEALEQDSAYAMTMEDYLHYEEEAFKTPNHGDIVDGVVVRRPFIERRISGAFRPRGQH